MVQPAQSGSKAVWMLVSMDMEATGGPRSHIRELCLNFAGLGYDVTLFAPGYGGISHASWDLAGVTVRYIPVGRKGLPGAAQFEIRLAKVVRRLLKTCAPAFIYAREIPAGAWIYSAARRKHVPYWIEKNGMVGNESAGRPVSRLYAAAVHLSERLAVLHCDGIIAVSTGIRARLLADYHVAPEHVAVILNGADEELFAPVPDRDVERLALHLPADRILLVFAGTLAPWQRVDVMVDAMAILEQRRPGRYALVVVGDGDEREALQRQIRRLGLETSVRLCGWVPYGDVHRYMGAADLALVLRDTSLAGITTFSPLKLFEYAFTGTPVIYSSSVVDPELTGRLDVLGREVATLQPEDLAQAVLTLTAEGRDARKRLCAARPALLEQHSWRAVAVGIVRLILGPRSNGAQA